MENQENPIYICPLVDFTFKRLFGTEQNKSLLIAFLNNTISSDTGVITDLQYLQQEQIGQFEGEKNVIFDIYCTNQQGDRFIIEMQRSKQHFFANRTIAYVGRAISNGLRKGDRTYAIPAIYSINLLDFQPNMFPNKDEYMWQVKFKDNENRIFSEKVVLYFFKLSNFAAQPKEKRQRFENQIEKWLYYLKNIQNMDVEDFQNEKDPVFRQLLEQCQYSKLNDMEQEDYKKSLLEYVGIRDAVECAREDGQEEGYNKGLKEGRKEGREEGREEERRQVALKLLSLGMDRSTIKEITGLNDKELEDLNAGKL